VHARQFSGFSLEGFQETYVMADESTATPVELPPRLSAGSALIRLAMIVVLLAAVVVLFAYLGGWLTPGELTPSRFVDGFEEVNGVHSGFRRNHAKGVCVSGSFESNGQGAKLSKAAVFQKGTFAVIGRFSFGGGVPDVPDKPDLVRGLGLEFSLPDGERWRTAMINLPVFPFRTPQAFYDQMIASKPDAATGKPDPAKMEAFLARYPETAKALHIIKGETITSGFGNTTFYGLNAFRFINASGESTPVRWFLTPVQPPEAAPVIDSKPHDKNYFFDALISEIHRQPLKWHLVVVIGKPGDPTNDATIVWPADREKVDVGTLIVDHVEAEETSPATNLNFDPLVLPDGIATSDDPLLSARSAVYSQSYTRREGETKQPSAITPAEVGKGE
jgi:catalase